MATKPPDKKEAGLQQVVESIRNANNVLVTINSSPTVDQLASCIGLTLVLNKLGKHATAVFSGEVPSTLEFLKPEETLEKNTDSLRDFIIALDKSKADKLRYKVEEDVVKVFITPYKTSIDEHDLSFSQGDFNVDVVVALGVEEKKHLDKAILDHGRILHDATVISVNMQNSGHIGSINWQENDSSSLCEMVSDIVQSLSKDVLDKQIATALLTGIVAETERYSNEKASPHTMSVAGELMSAGASTQLVSNELDSTLKPQSIPEISADNNSDSQSSAGGVLDIDHKPEPESESDKKEEDKQPSDTEQDSSQPEDHEESEVKDDKPEPDDEYLNNLNLSEDPHKSSQSDDSENQDSEEPDEEDSAPSSKASGRLVKDPPHFTGQLTANTTPEDKQYTGSTDPLSNLPDSQILGQKEQETPNRSTPTASSLQQKVDQTLKEIEESVSSPHLDQEEEQTTDNEQLSVDEARKAAEAAAADSKRPQPRQDIGTTRLGDDIDHQADSSSGSSAPPPPPAPPPIAPAS